MSEEAKPQDNNEAINPDKTDTPMGFHKGRQVKKAEPVAHSLKSGTIISLLGKTTPISERAGTITTVSPVKLFGDIQERSNKEEKEGIKILIRDRNKE
ncbi:hypothetical protein [Endozoicomonas sp. Mp262]|uniref:hypothetical protein n=1 Tax=Endozoicomonas sp. Mp262 TaxID=2919499 RepID=UPI0021DA3B27